MSNQKSDNNKRISKNTLLLYFRMFFIMAVSLFTSRVVLKTLGVEDFGIYNVVGGIVAMMGILNGAMSVSTQRYLTFELGKGDMVRLKQVFSTCFLIYLILSGIFLVLAETIGLWFLNSKLVIPEDRIVAANWVYQFSIISCVNTLMANPYNAVLIAREKMNIYAYISILEVVLKLAIVYLLLVIPLDRLIIYGGLYLLMSIVITMIYRIYCIKNYQESRFQFYWDKPLFMQLMSYSGWNLFGSLSSLVKGQGLNILLNMFFNPAVNASRGIAYQINNAITQFFTNFYTAVRPQITKYYAQGDLDNMFKLVFRSSKFSFYLIFLLSLPIIIEAPYIIQLWLGQLPDYVVPFTRMVVLISAIDSMASPLMTTCHATGRIKLYQSVVGTLIICNVPISYCFLKFFDCSPNIVFVVSLCLSTLALFIRIWIVRHLIESFPVWKYIKNVLLLSLVIAALSAILPSFLHVTMESSFLTCCIVVLSSLLSTLLFIYLLGLTKGEKKALQEIINKKLHR